MSTRIGEHLRGNVVAYVALFFALSGVAYALESNSVKSKHIVNDQVKTADVRDRGLSGGGLTSDDLAPNSVGDTQIVDGDVRTAEIANGSLTGEDIMDDSLTSDDLAPNSVGDTQIVDGDVRGAEVLESTLQFPTTSGVPTALDCDADGEAGKLRVDTTNNRLYVCVGAARGWDFVALTD